MEICQGFALYLGTTSASGKNDLLDSAAAAQAICHHATPSILDHIFRRPCIQTSGPRQVCIQISSQSHLQCLISQVGCYRACAAGEDLSSEKRSHSM